MTLLSVILALIIEQLHALPVVRAVVQPVAAWCGFLERQFNDGQRAHGALAWALGAALPALALLGFHEWLQATQGVAAFLLGLAVLYLTMGFRQFSHFFTEVQEALRDGDVDLARRTLADWREQAGEHLTATDIARIAIEEALLHSHRHVFAPLFWFAALGPAGALLYRLADRFSRHWGGRPESDGGRFGEFARRAFLAIDWIPVRLSAAAFAIVGDFEDAVYCWRTQSGKFGDAASGILLASGGGALGVQLGLPGTEPLQADGDGLESPDYAIGAEADPDFMQSTIGLAWRTLVLVLLVLALVTVSGSIGV
jgi:adenosylcobinamide-phosphate synthase